MRFPTEPYDRDTLPPTPRSTRAVTTATEPPAPRPGDHVGRLLVRGSVAAVLVALIVVGSVAFAVDRSRTTPSDEVTLAAPTATGTAPSPTPEAATATFEVAQPTSVSSPSPASAPVAPTEVPTPEPTPVPPRVALTPTAPGIGETFALRVHAPEAISASALIAGASYPLVATEDGGFFAVLGIPLNAALGPNSLLLTLRDDFGVVLEESAVPFEVAGVERPIDYLELTEEQGSVLTPEAAVLETQLRTQQFLSYDRQPQWSGLFLLPTEGCPTTMFGQGRSINGGPVGGFHSGADIASQAGTLIQAVAIGRVAWVGEMPIRGNAVIIDHGAGVKTGYHHLQAILVEVDQVVAPGTAIGEMGSTGFSTGPHLHWELTIYGVNVDPMAWTRTDFSP